MLEHLEHEDVQRLHELRTFVHLPDRLVEQSLEKRGYRNFLARLADRPRQSGFLIHLHERVEHVLARARRRRSRRNSCGLENGRDPLRDDADEAVHVRRHRL